MGSCGLVECRLFVQVHARLKGQTQLTSVSRAFFYLVPKFTPKPFLLDFRKFLSTVGTFVFTLSVCHH